MLRQQQKNKTANPPNAHNNQLHFNFSFTRNNQPGLLWFVMIIIPFLYS